jgi:hypothetical protein
MTLPALSLDDLTYEDLRGLAMRNIPAASAGRWTHHAPVDAGITLLELFAFLLEQQLFILDQVPDAMVAALLGLLGESPKPTRAARTVLVRGEGGAGGFVTLGEGEAFRPTSNGLASLVFTAIEPTLLPPVARIGVPPVARIGVSVDDEDVSTALTQKRSVELLAEPGAPARLEFDIQLDAPFEPGHQGRSLALALILEDTGVAPEWAEAAVDVPPPTAFTLHWQSGSHGGALADVTDGTRGLRRSGLIRFPVPAGFAGHHRLSLRLATTRVGHAAPLRLAAVHLGAAIAEHRWRRSVGPNGAQPESDPLWLELKAGIDGWLPVSGQVLNVPRTLAPIFENTVALRLLDSDGLWHDWTPAAELAALGPEDRRFTVHRDSGRLSFGDGYTGRVPAPAGDVALAVDLGGGLAGNHAAGLEWRGVADDRADLRLLSATAAIDGADPESLGEARARVAASLAERHRAVTAADYSSLVETTRGISRHRAHVAVGHDPHFPCRYISDSITVFVVPRTGTAVAAPRADDGALAAIRARLDSKRMLTSRVFVVRPLFRPVALEIAVNAGAGSSTSFEARLRPVLAAYIHPSEGGPEADGWPFGRPLRPSELIRVAQDALGAEAIVEQVSIRLEDEERDSERCTDVAIGPHELVRLSRLRVKLSAPARQGATM